MRLILAIAICAAAAAQERCPWLNAATAGGVLGGEVHVTLTPTSCEFVRQYNGRESALRIEVAPVTAPHAQCGSGAVPVKAIGNEAVACTYTGKRGFAAEQVVGRVRDQNFLVRISSNDPSLSQLLRQKARNVAEQVAGILF
jgi:hypothetical protein